MTTLRGPALYALVFTLFWLALTGSLTVLNTLLGLAVSALALSVLRGQFPEVDFSIRLWPALKLKILFFKELMRSATRVARLVLSPDMAITPGVVAVPISLTRDVEITLLANLITLTPGTLTVDVSEDRRALYVHALEADDPEAVKRDIRSGFERAIRETFR